MTSAISNNNDNNFLLAVRYPKLCRPQWPLSRMLRSWVQIPLKVWMSVCVYYVFVLGSCLAKG
jgi:hypothetical protein